MECNKDEAMRAMNIAENKMVNNDFEGGRKFALKAQKLFPELENISQMLAVCDVHCSAKRKINGDAKDLYGILQVETSADVATIKKHYRKLALVLHPDKNHFPGAEAAFKLIGEANMILSDEVKRNDYTSQNPQNKYSNASFWTLCPFCKMEYEYYRDLVNKRIKCLKCSKLFTAIDIGVYKSTQAPRSGMQNVNPQEKVKVYPQRAEPSFSHQPTQFTETGDAKGGENLRDKTVENGNIKPKVGKEGVANKGTGGNRGDISDSNGKNVGKSRKRPHVSNSEEVVADFILEKKSRLRKSSSDVKDKQKEIPAGAELKKEDDKSDSDSEDDSEPAYVDVRDLEFSNFDKDKEEHCFAVDQIWAIYDTIDCMPRFYARIRKVSSSGFRLRITWLEAEPEDLLERNWVEEGLPVACGKFKRGDSEETKDRLMFSHQMTFEKGSKRFSFAIYPKKGEIWALFKDWDIIKWSSDPENHRKYKYEIVEILSDFDKDNGVLVAYMVKVEGFVSLFQKTKLSEHRVPSCDLFRFSHHIPSQKLTGNERADVPVGSYELDTASLPDDLDQFYFSDNVKAQTSLSFPHSPEKTVCSKGNLNQSTNKSNISMSSLGNSSPSHQTKFTKSQQVSDGKESKIVIHNFSLRKQNRVFEEGQIWALGRSKNVNLRCYGQIKKIEIESTPLRLHVDLLELCSDASRPNACGIYKASTGGRQISEQDSFLYLVKAEVNGRNRFNIYPRKKEIWVLDKNQDGDCDIVEVVENNGDIIKVLFLAHVGGYESVFKGLDRVVEIPIEESHRFWYQVPAVLLTDEQDGRLRGFWELDLAEFPGLV